MPDVPLETDALIVGAGPVGLFQVFELGLLDIRAHVVEALPFAGGQCVELYADKPIYDIPAVAVCTGRELTERLLRQIEPFGATFHYEQLVTEVHRQSDGRFLVQTSARQRFLTKTLFIAAGVGAFQPRKLKVEGIEAFEGSQLFYRSPPAADWSGQHLAIVGEDELALDWALQLARPGAGQPARVTLLHRRDAFKADEAKVAQMRALCAAGQMDFIAAQITAWEGLDERLVALELTLPDASKRRLGLDALLVSLGLAPQLGPIAGWGLEMARKQLAVNTENFGTSESGIFAVGDVNSYPGKKKLILCGFHEATLAAHGAAALVFPGKTLPLQYTTSSTHLHGVLGVQR